MGTQTQENTRSVKLHSIYVMDTDLACIQLFCWYVMCVFLWVSSIKGMRKLRVLENIFLFYGNWLDSFVKKCKSCEILTWKSVEIHYEILVVMKFTSIVMKMSHSCHRIGKSWNSSIVRAMLPRNTSTGKRTSLLVGNQNLQPFRLSNHKVSKGTSLRILTFKK